MRGFCHRRHRASLDAAADARVGSARSFCLRRECAFPLQVRKLVVRTFQDLWFAPSEAGELAPDELRGRCNQMVAIVKGSGTSTQRSEWLQVRDPRRALCFCTPQVWNESLVARLRAPIAPLAGLPPVSALAYGGVLAVL
eukprot:130406-Pleurochrysis_carterae.AAC.1